MAAGQHNPSRRALLGAAVALPLVARLDADDIPPPAFASDCGGSPSPGKLEEEWEEALAAFRAAEAKVWEIEAATAGLGFEDEEALLPEHDAAGGAMEAALGRLMLVPAPDLAAFAVKLELFFEHELEPNSVEKEIVTAIRGDAARLAGLA